MKLITVVAAALVDDAARVLLAQRPQGKHLAGLWEFPGGKLEAGESPEAALQRELQEELGIAVQAGDMQPLAFVSHAYENFHLLMLLYGIRCWQGRVQMAEHSALKWTGEAEITALPMPPADVPLLEPLKQFMRNVSIK